MRQRVSIARALALDPEVLMMDEPFGALDAITREHMSDFLLEIWQRTGKTVVFVTHSIDEAVYLSDSVYVMATNPARIVQKLDIGLPQPKNEATFSSPMFHQKSFQLRQLLGRACAGERKMSMSTTLKEPAAPARPRPVGCARPGAPPCPASRWCC